VRNTTRTGSGRRLARALIPVGRNAALAVRRTQLTAPASYAYLENVALEESRGGGIPR
jgi:hypothetical protein